MSGSIETYDASKDDNETNVGAETTQTPKPDQFEEGKKKITGNRRGDQSHGRE